MPGLTAVAKKQIEKSVRTGVPDKEGIARRFQLEDDVVKRAMDAALKRLPERERMLHAARARGKQLEQARADPCAGLPEKKCVEPCEWDDGQCYESFTALDHGGFDSRVPKADLAQIKKKAKAAERARQLAATKAAKDADKEAEKAAKEAEKAKKREDQEATKAQDAADKLLQREIVAAFEEAVVKEFKHVLGDGSFLGSLAVEHNLSPTTRFFKRGPVSEDRRKEFEVWKAKLKRVKWWAGHRQGQGGFNAKVDKFLAGDGPFEPVQGELGCDKKGLMLYQAVPKAMVHPLTPIRRFAALHCTGSGKSIEILAMVDNFFYDERPKLIVVPTDSNRDDFLGNLVGPYADVAKDSPLLAWLHSRPEFAGGLDALPSHVFSVADVGRRIEIDRTSGRVKVERDGRWVRTSVQLAKGLFDDAEVERVGEDVVVVRSAQGEAEFPNKTSNERYNFLDRLRAALNFCTVKADSMGDSDLADAGEAERDYDGNVMEKMREVVLKQDSERLARRGKDGELVSPICVATYREVYRLNFYGGGKPNPAMRVAFEARAHPAPNHESNFTRVSFDGVVQFWDECQNFMDERLMLNPTWRTSFVGDKKHLRSAQRALDNFKAQVGDDFKTADLGDKKGKYTTILNRRARMRGIRNLVRDSTNSVVVFLTATPITASVNAKSTLAKDKKRANDEVDEFLKLLGVRKPDGKASVDAHAEGYISMFLKDSESGMFAKATPAEDELPRLLPLVLPREEVLGEDAELSDEDDEPSAKHTRSLLSEFKRRQEYVNQALEWTTWCVRMDKWWEGEELADTEQAELQKDLDQGLWLDPESARPERLELTDQRLRKLAAHQRDQFDSEEEARFDYLTAPVFAARKEHWDFSKMSDSIKPIAKRQFRKDEEVAWQDNKKVFRGVVSDVVEKKFEYAGKSFGAYSLNSHIMVKTKDGVVKVASSKARLVSNDRSRWYYNLYDIDDIYVPLIKRHHATELDKRMQILYGKHADAHQQHVHATELEGRDAIWEGMSPVLRTFLRELFQRVFHGEFSDGKTLVLMDDALGLAYVERYVAACPELVDSVKVFGMYAQAQERTVGRRGNSFIKSVFNSRANLRGDECKVFIGSTRLFGTGITFTEVRRIVRVAPAHSWLEKTQNDGRALRLCKHMLLDPGDQDVTLNMAAIVLRSDEEDTVKGVAVRAAGGSVFAMEEASAIRMQMLIRSREAFLGGMRRLHDISVDKRFLLANGVDSGFRDAGVESLRGYLESGLRRGTIPYSEEQEWTAPPLPLKGANAQKAEEVEENRAARETKLAAEAAEKEKRRLERESNRAQKLAEAAERLATKAQKREEKEQAAEQRATEKARKLKEKEESQAAKAEEKQAAQAQKQEARAHKLKAMEESKSRRDEKANDDFKKFKNEQLKCSQLNKAACDLTESLPEERRCQWQPSKSVDGKQIPGKCADGERPDSESDELDWLDEL